MHRRLRKLARDVRAELSLPAAARRQRARDRRGPPARDPGIGPAVDAAIDWLCRAQDRSASADGGVARDFSLIKGWATSYPETTGYIVPTLLDVAAERDDDGLRQRARRMLGWLVSIQFTEGGFQGGKADVAEPVAVTFNTGQILLGLARGAAEFGDPCAEPMHRAARWLADTQDADGCWRRHATPFAKPGEKTYETHVAWGLLEAARVAPDADYGEAGLRNVRWALTKQQDNGWFADCCLSDATRPLTHTIGYALRGIVEAWRFSGDEQFLAAARRTADAIVRVTEPDGRLAGQWRSDWTPAAEWVCLTGSVQIAHSLLLLHRDTGEERYLDTGCRLNQWVRRTMDLDGPEDVRGGIKGSFPVDGAYGRYEYLNWAAKFFVDSNRCEQECIVGPAS
ncbi:MAG: hypothetical protein U5K33_06640 [Halofilum sp. (in: g-proteobacteria)]|nr:hypothetical protein [Halofilum sp. (in: g-proteobacteria)]